MKNRSIIDQISESVHQRDPNAEAFLFGSRARGDHRPNSDWDILILVEAPGITQETEDKFREPLYDIELESGQIISTFLYTKDDWKGHLKYSPLFENVTKEGLRL